MTITAQDVYSTLESRVGYPPIRAQDIDRVVRVLNAHCHPDVTVSDSLDLAVIRVDQDRDTVHVPLSPTAVFPQVACPVVDDLTEHGTPRSPR